MTKEDKQIIDRAVKEEWRIGDRSRLKRLLEKNLKLYRENVELEQKLEQTEKDLADYQFNYPTIKELEKENAELKETLKTYNGCGDWDNDFHTCRVYLQHEELQKYVEQLTKAKDLLQRFIKWARTEHCEKFDVILEQTEQFIKEI